MFGNVQGWIISVVMLLAAGAGFYKLLRPPGESSPANLVPLAYQPVKLPIDPARVAPPGTGGCDAGDLYRQAIQEYQKNPGLYEKAAEVDSSKLPALQLVLQAADCSRMRLFENNPKRIINYGRQQPWVDALMGLGQATVNAAVGLKDKPDEAKKYYLAAFALGRNMFDERVAWPELNNGISIMTMAVESLTTLADAAHDTQRVGLLQEFNDKAKAYQTTLQEQVDIPIANPAEDFAAKFSGDIYAIAKNTSVDRMWRVEAILHVGHYRWDVAPDRRGDQTAAVPELQKLEMSDDPKNDSIIKTAARAAQDLTVEQQHATGS